MKLLIAGLGSVGRRHLHNLQVLGCENVILYRTGRSTLPEDELAGIPTETDLAIVLAHHPQAAIIANPTSLHVETALACVQAGCHLFIEKPLSQTLKGCAELEVIAKQQQLVTMIGCQFRFHPLLIALHKQLQAGRIGEVISARAEWGEYIPNWHPWEDYRCSYSARKDLGGGAILTLIHPLDYLYWLFGRVKRIHASMRSVSLLQADVEDDLAEITLEFASGVIGQVHLDYIQSPPVHTLTIWGDNGCVKWDYYADTLCWEAVNESIHVDRVPDGFERNTMFLDEMRHFLECVEQHKPTHVPLEDGIAVLEIALRAKQDALEERRHD